MSEQRRDEVTGRDLAELVWWARRIEGQAEAFKDRWSGTAYAGDVVTVRGLLSEVGRAVGDLVAWCEGQEGGVSSGIHWRTGVTLPYGDDQYFHAAPHAYNKDGELLGGKGGCAHDHETQEQAFACADRWAAELNGDLPIIAGHCFLCDVTYGAEGHVCLKRAVEYARGVRAAPIDYPEGLEGGLTGRSEESRASLLPVGIDPAGLTIADGSTPGHRPLSTEAIRVEDLNMPAATKMARVSEPGSGLQLPGEAERGGSTCLLCGGSGVVEYQEVEYETVEGGWGVEVWVNSPCDCQIPALDEETG